MVFSSYLFLFIFLPITLLLFRLSSGHPQISKCVLIGASLVFYAAWDVAYVPVILASIFVNYYLGRSLHSAPVKRNLVAGIAFNLGLLGYFKYTDMFIQTLGKLFSDNAFSLFDLALPLGISFFTFQQIAYLVDSYRRQTTRSDLRDYSLFVLFFPQLIAGPIVHHKEMLRQFRDPKTYRAISDRQFVLAILLIVVGLFKKVVIADSLSPWVVAGFDPNLHLEFYDSWVASLAYTLQIYFDFSAYCEIAMGVAMLFGIQLPLNFDSPYRSKNISEFWRRWHITLGRFLRDYLFIPLGGSRNGHRVTLFALLMTMLLGGLWHGAGWQFVLWGAMHGLALCAYHLWKQQSFRLPSAAASMLTLIFVIFAWVPFRAESIGAAFSIWKTMLGLEGIALPAIYGAAETFNYFGSFVGWEIGVLMIMLVLVCTTRNIHEHLSEFSPSLKNLAYSFSIATVVIIYLGRPQTFIYFDF